MQSKHKKTLAAIFSKPTPKGLEWRKIEALLLACGAQLIEGNGSRISFSFGEHVASFHRPHPHKEAKPYQVLDAKRFLEKMEVTR